MTVTKWTTVNLMYAKNEKGLAKKEHKNLLRLGYSLKHSDVGYKYDNYDYSDQYIKNLRTREKVGL